MNPLRRLRRRRTGQLPEQLRTELAAEGVQLLEEQLSGSITVRGYRAPREYASWKKELVSGALVITRRRLVVWVRGSKHIDLPLGHPMRDALEVVAERPDRLRLGYEASDFDESRSGRVEVRLRPAHATRWAGLWHRGPLL